MRPIFVDLLFSWPPHGGGDVDIYHVVKGTADAGYDPLLVIFRDDAWERGHVQDDLPFEVQARTFRSDYYTPEHLTQALKEVISGVRPCFVFLGQGFLLKPFLSLVVPDSVPVISRLHAHEAACLKDITRFRDGAPCPKSWFSTPDACVRCALDAWSSAIRHNAMVPWLRELLAVRPWLPERRRQLREAWKRVTMAMVNNQSMVETLAPLGIPCRVTPSGIDLKSFPPQSWNLPPRNPPVVFMPGRAEDPVKGFPILLRACEMLVDQGIPLELQVTLAPSSDLPGWVKPLGWLSHKELSDRYATASVVAVPSVWEEPFGLTALEAMASGRPVVASATGGLQETVLHGETGLLVPPGDVSALAEAIRSLLAHPDKARHMGARGVERARAYAWETIMARHYLPLWRELAPARESSHG